MVLLYTVPTCSWHMACVGVHPNVTAVLHSHGTFGLIVSSILKEYEIITLIYNR